MDKSFYRMITLPDTNKNVILSENLSIFHVSQIQPFILHLYRVAAFASSQYIHTHHTDAGRYKHSVIDVLAPMWVLDGRILHLHGH